MAVDAQRQSHHRHRKLDPVSVGVIICALVAITLGSVGVLERGTTPWVLLPGLLALVVGSATLFRSEP